MAFLTIFSTPKPFTNPHIATIQRNAIRSWQHLGPDVEVLLIGDEPGLAETAGELGVRCLADVRRNEQGTPLVSHIFELAREHSISPLLGYVNADILLLPDLLDTARTVSQRLEKFLLVGQRWDLEVTTPLDFSGDWDARLREDLHTRGSLHAPAGSDYFVFPRSCFQEMPPFAIGRAGWDNWMIYQADQCSCRAVDATPSITAVHQNHDYSHLPDGQAHYKLAESDVNRSLAGGKSHMYNLLDARVQFKDGRLVNPPLTRARIIRKAELLFYPRQGDLTGWRRYVTTWLRTFRTRYW